VSRYKKKHSPTHTYLDHQSSFICFFHLLQSIASSLFNLRDWQSFCTTSLQVLFGLPLGLAPSTLYSIHLHSIIVFFSQHMPIPLQPVLLYRLCHLSLVCLSTLLETLPWLHLYLCVCIHLVCLLPLANKRVHKYRMTRC